MQRPDGSFENMEEMVDLSGDAAKPVGNLLQRRDPAKVEKQHRAERIRACGDLAVRITLVFADDGAKLGSADDRFYDLREQARSFPRHSTLPIAGGTSILKPKSTASRRCHSGQPFRSGS